MGIIDYYRFFSMGINLTPTLSFFYLQYNYIIDIKIMKFIVL